MAEQTNGDRMEPSERHWIVVDLNDRLVGRDAGVIGERCAKRKNEIALVHEPACDRRSRPTEHAAAKWVMIADLALALERRGDGSAQMLRQLDDRVHVLTRTSAHDDQGALSVSNQVHRCVERFRWWGR